MPAPETNHADVYAYLLRRNAHLFGMWFALGPEDAVYLVGRVPARLVDDDELDRIAGLLGPLHRRALPDGDDHGPPRRRYRRRPRRSLTPASSGLGGRGSVSSRGVSSLLIVGGGKMGGALLGGLAALGMGRRSPTSPWSSRLAERRDELAASPARVCASSPRPSRGCWTTPASGSSAPCWR